MQAEAPPTIESHGDPLVGVYDFGSILPDLVWAAPLLALGLALAWLALRVFWRWYRAEERADQKQKAAGRVSDGLR